MKLIKKENVKVPIIYKLTTKKRLINSLFSLILFKYLSPFCVVSVSFFYSFLVFFATTSLPKKNTFIKIVKNLYNFRYPIEVRKLKERSLTIHPYFIFRSFFLFPLV